MKTIGDLVGVDFPLLWHEAVAVVQDVASHVSPDRGIPADRDLLFNEDGTITVGVASQSSHSRLRIVTALGRLLQRLLPADAPAALRAFASENSSEQPTHPTLEAFTGALAFFERPGRAGHLLAVATRLQSYTPPSPEEELDRLRKKVIEGADDVLVSPPVTRRSIRSGYAAGGALALVAVIAGARLPVGGFLGALSSISLPSLGGSFSNTAASTAADPIEKSGSATDAANAAADGPAAHRVAADRRRSLVPPPAGSIVGSAGSLQSVATSQADVNDPASAGAPQDQPSTAPPAAPDRDTTPRVDPGKIYSNEDVAVTPAAFVHPQLPSEPQPGPSTGYFDLTVDESGNVATVRLVTPARRYQEQLLVSAAKAWRFRPALLEGRPVKYRVRVPITLPGPQ